MKRLIIIPFMAFGLAALASCGSDRTSTQMQDTVSGEVLAKRLCASCHAVGSDDASVHPDAPPFRTLSQSYPIEHLAEALAEGIMVGHPDMPVFEMSPGQIDAFLFYLEQLQVEPAG